MQEHYPRSSALARRARAVIPGGWHLSGRPLLPRGAAPHYFVEASGSSITDADGNVYTDFILAYGPPILGHARREVDEAAFAQARRGNLLSVNHALHVAFVERLLTLVPGAEMGMFFKTGSDATTAAVRIARRATGRKAIARCGYHGWHDWCLPEEDFAPEGMADQVRGYDALHPATLAALLAREPGRYAAVILAPEMIHPPSAEKILLLMALAREHGALFIMDEVKTGIRAPGWTMQACCGIRPDMTTLSKALGNGWPVGAVLGPRAVMEHAAGMHVSATYHGEVAAMAAALATLDLVERENVQQRIEALGTRLIDGLNAAAARNRIPALAHGEPIPAMPFLRFAHPEPGLNDRLREAVFEQALAQGLLLHPRHLWFICAAHDEAQIDRAIDVIDGAMHRAALTFGGAAIAPVPPAEAASAAPG